MQRLFGIRMTFSSVEMAQKPSAIYTREEAGPARVTNPLSGRNASSFPEIPGILALFSRQRCPHVGLGQTSTTGQGFGWVAVLLIIGVIQ